MPKDKLNLGETVAESVRPAHHPQPHELVVCAVCKEALGPQRYRALDSIVCSTECAKVVHGD